MGRGVRLVAGLALVGLGLFVALYPFVSVWRLTGEVLDELPELGGVDQHDTRHRFGALADPDFTLAERVVTGISVDEVERALAAGGFEPWSVGTRAALAKPCCGDYDAMVAEVTAGPEPGAVTVALTAADGDVQSVVLFFVVVGLVLLVPGAGLLAAVVSQPDPVRIHTPSSPVPT